ncbi:hypothetical protein [Tropicimonas aquimaris]|uniref:Glycerol-3-phosphate dehydrogenase n=1 Tax=Tropicimonas aquimaris TaxID=914152 RepID=A0ABW3ISB1_9RHOB
MSERVANAEIEDVLLSIRRLVQGDSGGSVGEGGLARQDSPSFADQEAPAADDRQEGRLEEVFSEPARPKPGAEALVLTPALRVDDGNARPVSGTPRPNDELRFEPEDPPLDSPPAGARLHFELPDEEDLDDFSDDEWADDPEAGSGFSSKDPTFARKDAAADGAPDDTGGVPSFVRAVVGDLNHLREAQEKGSEPDRGGPDPETGEHSATELDDAEAAPLVEEPAAPRSGFRFGQAEETGVRNLVSLHDGDDDLQAKLPDASGSATVVGLSDEKDDFGEVDDLQESRADNDLLSSIVSTFDAMEKSFTEEKTAEFVDDWQGETEEKVEALDPEALEEDAYFVEAEDDSALSNEQIDDLSEAASIAPVDVTPETEISDPEVPSEAAGFVLDEALLSELIADCVHRELQGELGERITRNVRKLVRREIHRALAMRDFD